MTSTLLSPSTLLPLYNLIIDGGGTKTALRFHSLSSPSTSLTTLTTSTNPSDLGLSLALATLSSALASACAQLGPHVLSRWEDTHGRNGRRSGRSSLFGKVWAGLSGLDSEEDGRRVLEGLRELLGCKEGEEGPVVWCSNDCWLMAPRIFQRGECISKGLLPHEGTARGKVEGSATDDYDEGTQQGVVLIAGTGAIAMAFSLSAPSSLSPLGSIQFLGRTSGFGYLLCSDTGSSFDLGSKTLVHYLSLIDIATSRYPSSPSSPSLTRQASALAELRSSTLFRAILTHYDLPPPPSPPLHEPLTSSETTAWSLLLPSIYSPPTAHLTKIRIAFLARHVQLCAYPPPASPSEAPDPTALALLSAHTDTLTALLEEQIANAGIDPKEATLVLGTGMWEFRAWREDIVTRWKRERGWRRIRRSERPEVDGADWLVGGGGLAT